MAKTRLRDTPKGRGPVDEKPDPPKRWWNEPKAERGQVSTMGQLLYQELAAIERSQMNRRYLDYVCALLMDGRAPSTFGYSMSAHSSREHTAMSTAMFRPPSKNCIASIGDVLKERVWSRVSWLEWLPVSKSDYESRKRCSETTEWMSSFFEETNFEEMISMSGHEAATYGAAFVRTMPSLDRTKVENTRVSVDEMRVSSDANRGEPKHIGQVEFLDREDLINVFGKSAKGAEIRRAILKAPAAFRGFMNLDVNYSDIVCLIRGFKFDLPDGTPGRHALCLADGFTLVDEEWTLGNPYSVLRYNKLSRNYMGKGVPENNLAQQMELDRAVSCRAEAQRQASYPHVQIERGAHIDPNSLEGAGVIEYTETPARFDVTSGTPKDLGETIRELATDIFAREGISQNTAGGDLPAGLDAGVAIEAFQNLSDGRLFSHAKNVERFIEDIGNKTIRCAALVNPKVRVGQKDIPWTKVRADLKKSRMQAFPLSKLPFSLPGRLNTIDRWAKRGRITAAQEARLLDLPDTYGQLPMIAASENCILFQLGNIVETGEYEPPDPDSDPAQAYEIAKAYKLVAVTDRLQRDRIVELVKFVAACKARVPPPPAAPAPGPAGQPQPQQPGAM